MARLKLLFDVFTKVVTCVVLGTAVYCRIFFPQVTFGEEMLWQILSVSPLTSMGTLFYVDDITQKNTKIMCVIHYITVNVIVFGCGFWFEWFYPDNLQQVIGMAILIALVFLTVSVVSWKRAMQMAKLMNARLAEYREKRE